MSKKKLPPGRHTLRSIASELGVSTTTVSRVINGKSQQYGIAELTRQRVLEHTRNINFFPDPVARGLRLNKMHTIGLVLPDLRKSYFSQIAQSLSDATRKRSYMLHICVANNDAQIEMDALHQLIARNIDGLVICPTGQDTEYLEVLRKQHFPVIQVARYLSELSLPYVASDNRAGSYLATCHLLKEGHKKIACLNGAPGMSVSQDRLDGYLQAIREYLHRISNKLITGDCYTKENGYRSIRQLLASGVSFTAVLAMSNQIAMGALQALNEAGKHIPEDVSLVCFDDFDGVEFFETPLTVVTQAVDKIGQVAADKLFQMIDAPEKQVEQKRLIPVRLIKRNSVKPPRKA